MNNIDSLYKKIDYYQNLEENWDGYGATAPSIKVCDFAKEFVEFIKKNNMKIPKTQVTSHEVGFYYNNVKENYMEMSCDEEGIEKKEIFYIICIKNENCVGSSFLLGEKTSEQKFLDNYKDFILKSEKQK